MSEGWWAILGVVIGALSSGIVSVLLQNRSFAHEKEMLKLQNQSEENVKETLVDILNHRKFVRRSFDAISKRVGGYSEDEIRKLLHEVNAKRAGTTNDGEWWYLAEREQEYIDSRKSRGAS